MDGADEVADEGTVGLGVDGMAFGDRAQCRQQPGGLVIGQREGLSAQGGILALVAVPRRWAARFYNGRVTKKRDFDRYKYEYNSTDEIALVYLAILK